ncbi:hypothetical protein Tco_0004799 [Tanacetum coccineum]
MNPQETLQAAARDEKWVPSAERVKISSTNITLETIVPQNKETFQVVINIIKNSTCFKAFTISADVPEIFMQQFYTPTILDICPRVEGVDFADVPDDDTALTFLIDLGYKGPLNKHTNMFVDHIENVDYLEFIWKDFAYQIDHRKEKRLRRENMPYPRFTKIIINHFLKQHKSLTYLNHKHYHTIKDDRIVSRLKFVRIVDDYKEYGLPIPDVMLTDAIKRSESYQMFIIYSTNQIPPKKSGGKAKKKTASRRVVKKKVTLSTDDNIISNDPDAALELAKSISQTEAEEAEAAKKVHATHARIVTESVPESAKKKSGGRSFKSVVIQDTLSALKLKPATSKSKLKGAPSLTLAEQEAANIMQALKESKKTSRRLPGIGDSNEGTSTITRVPDKSTVGSATSSEGTSIKSGVLDEEKDITKEKVILEWGDEQDSKHSDDDNDDVEKDDKKGDVDDEGDYHVSDTQDTDDEDVETESDKDDIYKYKIHVRKDEDVEMKDVEVEETDKGEEKVTNATKEEAEKTLEAKDDTKKTELPPSSSSLSIQSLSIQKILVSVIPETTNLPPILEIVTKTPVTTADPSPQVTPIILTVQQTTTPIPTPTIINGAPTVTTVVPESNALTTVELRVAKLEKDMSELKTVYHSSEALAVLQSYVPTVVDTEQESEKSPSEILKIKKEQAESQKNPQFTIKSTDKAALEEYDLKSALYQSMHANKSFNINPTNHRLSHALMEALIEDENAMDKGVADTVKDHKRKHDDDEDPLAGPNQGKKTKRRRTKESESSKKPSTTKETLKGKASTKGSKTGKSALAKEQVEEPITEVIIDDVGDDVARIDNPPQDTSEPKTRKTLNLEWFKQPPRPPTPDPEWNKHQDPLTFHDLMATPIDFSKYMLNGLKIENLAQDILLGPAFNLLKGTCSNSIELEYNFQECFNALTDKLDWNNLEGYRYPFDLSKPLPLQGAPGHRTVAADYFFNNDLEYLKTSDPEVTYTTSVTKTKAAQYEIKGIEDMVPTLWSTIMLAYDKDALMEIKYWGERCKLCVSTKKLHGYGHLEEVVVKRSDQQLYTFKEGDFVDLHLNDIEDMPLLVVQHKLFHLDGNVIVDFIVALRMFTRSIILKRRVEDLQLGVGSYQKKLNITKPQKTFPEIEFKEPYTLSYDPPGIVYKDMNKQKRVLRADELYKFSDGTLKSVRDEIHQRVLDFHLDYNTKMPKRKWAAVDRKRSGLMVELIDKQL